MKALQPNKQQHDNSLCDTCVYCLMNLDREQYDGKGIGELPDDGCSLDFVPGDSRCDEMRTSNCSMRRPR
jgi:hypothetical protein